MESSLIIAVIVATMATFVWRVLGVVIAGKINLEHPLYQWFVHVSYAAVAAVLCLNLFVGNGHLSTQEILLRALALVVGIVVSVLCRRQVFWGLISAVGLYTLALLSGF